VSDVPESVIFATTRVQSTFSSEYNPARTWTATGFFVDCGGWSALVTNRHVVDPSLTPKLTGWKLERLEIQVRRGANTEHQPEVEFVEADLGRSKIICSKEADVAAIGVALVYGEHEHLTFGDIDIANIADEAFLCERARLMDLASFVSFASSGKTTWWDERWNTPIARLASLASLPSRPYYNNSIKTADVGLVSGLSFTGSSGSPLFLHAKGMRNMSVANASYQEPKLIGLMSGHWELADERAPEMFQHSGLSYYTRATAIRDVIERLAAIRVR